MKRPVFVPLILLLLAVIAACKNEDQVVRRTSDRLTFSPPINGVDVPFASLPVDAATGDMLTFRTGTKISVPEKAFVDALGNPITGQVMLQYRELHDAADIFLAGIPLDYDSASHKYHLTTAGMFEIYAMKDNREVFLAPGKTLMVKMASWQPGLEYNFYRLGKDMNWNFLGSSLPEVNVPQPEKVMVPKSKPHQTLAKGAQYFCFNYMNALDIFMDQASAEGKNATKQEFEAKAKAYGLRFLRYPALEPVYLFGTEYPAAALAWKHVSGKPVPGYIDSSNRVLFLPKGRQYELKVLSPDKKVVSSSVIEPVMPLASLFAHSPEYWHESFDEGMIEVEREVQRVGTEAAVFRFFEINQMGVYNWDKIKNQANSVQVLASFPIKGKDRGEYAFQRTAILFPGDNRSVIKLPQSDWENNFYLAPDPGARIAMILPGQQLAIFTPEQFRKIPFEKFFNQQGWQNDPNLKKIPPYEFEMSLYPSAVATAADFRKAVGF